MCGLSLLLAGVADALWACACRRYALVSACRARVRKCGRGPAQISRRWATSALRETSLGHIPSQRFML